MRGNRTVKIDTGSLDAFDCPNMPPLVNAGINIEVDYKAIHRPTTIEKVFENCCLKFSLKNE
jgi:lysophospholipase